VSKKAIVLSVKTPYADLILDGIKTLEVRTKRLPWSDIAYIYSSGFLQQIVGSCSYVGPVTLPLERVLEGACLSREQYDDYVGDKFAYVYEIRNVVDFTKSYELSDFGLQTAPQSWSYARFIPASCIIAEG